MTVTEQYDARRKAIEDLIADEPAVTSNDYEIPDKPARYLVVELYGGEAMWAQDEDTLQDCADYLHTSDTEHDDCRAYNLDTGDRYDPVFNVVKWIAVAR